MFHIIVVAVHHEVSEDGLDFIFGTEIDGRLEQFQMLRGPDVLPLDIRTVAESSDKQGVVRGPKLVQGKNACTGSGVCVGRR